MRVHKPKNSTNYHYRFNFDGKPRTGSCYTANKADATRFMMNVKEQMWNAKHLPQQNSNEITLEDAVATYMRDMQANGTGTKNYSIYHRKLLGSKIDTSTKKKMKVHGLRGGDKLHKVRDRDVQQLITARRQEGNSPATILYELVFLSQVIKHAKRLDYIIPLIDFEGLKKANKIRPAPNRIRVLSPEEFSRLINELARVDEFEPQLNSIFRLDTMHFTVLLANIGCRQGELCRLKWSDINMDEGTFRLWRPKVRNETVIPMSKIGKVIFETRLAHKAPDQEYLFEGRYGGHRGYAPKAFKAACVRAGLTDVSFHTLRHTFASNLLNAKVSMATLQHLLGHQKISTTEKYAHLAPFEAAQDAMKVLNALNEMNEVLA